MLYDQLSNRVQFASACSPTRIARTAIVPFIIAIQIAASAHGEDARLGLEYVPPGTLAVVSLRPAELATRGNLGDVLAMADSFVPAFEGTNLKLRDIREVMQINYGLMLAKRVVVRFVDPAQQTNYLDAITKRLKLKQAPGANEWQGDSEKFIQIDATTVVWEQTTAGGQSFAPLKNSPPRWAQAWLEQNDQSVVLALSPREILQKTASWPFHLVGDITFFMFHPLLYKVDWTVGGIAVRDKLQCSGIVQCNDAKSVTTVRDTLQALAVTMSNYAQLTAMVPMNDIVGKVEQDPQAQLRKKAYEIAASSLATTQTKIDDTRVRYSLESSISTERLTTFAALGPAYEASRRAARELQSQNNLKQVGLAMLNYEATRKVFPAAVSYSYYAHGQRQRSKFPHSWRVDILPYLEEAQLHEGYHYDEPWDSEANKQVMAHMPSVYRSTKDPDPKSTNTSCFVLTGPGTIFDGEEGTKMRTITDGTTNTILAVEANRPVPWTKPEDIPYEADKPVPKLGGWWPDHFLVVMADCSTATVPTNIDEAILRAHITKRGGEYVQGWSSK